MKSRCISDFYALRASSSLWARRTTLRLKRFDLAAVMARESDTPGVQDVPAAMAIDVDQTPEAQRWKEEPSAEQHHAPSSVQGPDCTPVVDPLGAGAPADATEEAAFGAPLAAGIGETSAVDVATGAADAVPVAKTPGEPDEDASGATAEEVPMPKPGAEEAPDGLTPAADEVTAGAEADEGLPEGLPEGAPVAAAQGGRLGLTPMAPFSTEEPGSG